MSFFRKFLEIITWPLRMLVALPVRIVSAPRRLMGMSLPTRVAVVLAIVLVLITIVYYIASYFVHGDDYPTLGAWLRPTLPYVIVLLIIIPLVVHRAVKLWLEGDVSQFPDIDHAWREGLKALAEHDIELTNVPVFFVLGVRDDRQAKALFDASQLSLSIKGIPAGRSALQWFGNKDAVFLVCNDMSCLSRVSQKGELIAQNVIAGPAPTEVLKSANLGGTITASALQAEMRETAVTRAGTPDTGAPVPSPLSHTMMIGPSATMVPSGSASTPSAGPTVLSPVDAVEMTERLAYVCRLLQRARQPLCPANGVLTLLPFDIIQRTGADVEILRAARSDHETLRRSLRMRCPVVALMSGMEEESGFRELVRRVGAERAKAQRFGKGFNVWNEPTGEQVEAVCAHACKAFEDWAYLLFREKDGLTRPGNKKLYALLCKIRTQFRGRLKNILVGAFADNRAIDVNGLEPMLFGGCYFGAIGATEDKQAFVKSVFDKLMTSEEELEWGDEAIREDDRYHLWTQILLFVDGLLLMIIGGYAAFLWLWRSE